MPRASPQKNNPATVRRTSGRYGAPILADAGLRPMRSITRTTSFGRLLKSRMTGDLPSFNDWNSRVVCNGSLYLFGGCHPDNADPTCDFYRWDIRTLQWTDLTNSTSFCSNPGNPFGDRPVITPLPRLHKPAIASLTLGGRNFMLLFGGQKKDSLTADLIAIDLESLTWFIMPIDSEGGPAAARMSASMVTVKNRIYIFGGLKLHAINSYKTLDTYCIAEYTNHDRKWRWIVRDEPYPEHILSLGYDLGAVPVYGGKKILLMAGRDNDNDPMTLTSDKCVLFHTTHHTFQVQSDTVGDFPKSMRWFNVDLLPSVRSASISSNLTRQGSKRTPQTLGSSSSSSTNEVNVLMTPAIISAWIPHGTSYLVPELWKYSPPPDEECRCLDLRHTIWALELDLQTFVVVDGRAFLLGRESDTDTVWNVCVEILI